MYVCTYVAPCHWHSLNARSSVGRWTGDELGTVCLCCRTDTICLCALWQFSHLTSTYNEERGNRFFHWISSGISNYIVCWFSSAPTFKHSTVREVAKWQRSLWIVMLRGSTQRLRLLLSCAYGLDSLAMEIDSIFATPNNICQEAADQLTDQNCLIIAEWICFNLNGWVDRMSEQWAGGEERIQYQKSSATQHSFGAAVPGVPDIGINRREFISDESMLFRRVALNLLKSFNEPFRAGNPCQPNSSPSSLISQTPRIGWLDGCVGNNARFGPVALCQHDIELLLFCWRSSGLGTKYVRYKRVTLH